MLRKYQKRKSGTKDERVEVEVSTQSSVSVVVRETRSGDEEVYEGLKADFRGTA